MYLTDETGHLQNKLPIESHPKTPWTWKITLMGLRMELAPVLAGEAVNCTFVVARARCI